MKIFLLTSTRADFGLLKNLIKKLNKDKKFNLKVIVTGSHLSKKHGLSLNEIKQSKIKVFKKIKISNSTKSNTFLLNDIGILSKKLSYLINQEKPHLMILLGDRYETLGAALAAYISKIPIAHIHGGEITSGSLDDGFRHSISKLSTIHFVSNLFYKKRLIQLGENPKTIFNVGSLGVENIFKTKLLEKDELQNRLKIKFKNNILSICLQPEITKSVTLKLVNETLSALKNYNDKTLIFTLPGVDLNNSVITDKLKYFVKRKKNAFLFKTLGSQNYLSLLKISDACIGNSSSGIIEMPTFNKPTINIGTRQEGRVRAKSVIDVSINRKEIQKKINLIYDKKVSKNFTNPYNKSNTSKNIISILKNFNINKHKIKKFFDISFKL